MITQSQLYLSMLNTTNYSVGVVGHSLSSPWNLFQETAQNTCVHDMYILSSCAQTGVAMNCLWLETSLDNMQIKLYILRPWF